VTGTDPEIERLRRRLKRERRARREAEQIAESTTSALYDRQRELQLLEAVAVAANEAATREDALQVAMERICTHLRWPVGHALLLNSDEGRLVSTGRWHVAEGHCFEGFRAASEATTFASGVGFPAGSWPRGRPCGWKTWPGRRASRGC